MRRHVWSSPIRNTALCAQIRSHRVACGRVGNCQTFLSNVCIDTHAYTHTHTQQSEEAKMDEGHDPTGLTSVEADMLIEKFGRNEIPEEKVTSK